VAKPAIHGDAGFFVHDRAHENFCVHAAFHDCFSLICFDEFERLEHGIFIAERGDNLNFDMSRLFAWAVCLILSSSPTKIGIISLA